MARSFADIGSTIFDFFFQANDEYRTIDIDTESGSTGFSVSRINRNDDTVNTSLTVTKQFENSLISSLSLTTSDTDNPSINITSDKLKNKNISISSTVCDPDINLDLNYNDTNKLCLDLSLNSNFTTQQFNDIDISVSYDSLLNKHLLIGANLNINNQQQQQTYNVGLEYKYNDNLLIGLKANDNLKNFDVGLMYDKFRGYDKNTLFGKISVDNDNNNKSIDYSLGINRTINDKSNIDFIVNKNNTFNVRYNTNNASNLSGFIAANFDLNDVQSRAKLQYGISIE